MLCMCYIILFCSNLKVGTLSWDASEAAENYVVTAQTNSGHVMHLNTTNTSAAISNFLCGEEYFLSVAAHDSMCQSSDSPPVLLTTGIQYTPETRIIIGHNLLYFHEIVMNYLISI